MNLKREQTLLELPFSRVEIKFKTVGSLFKWKDKKIGVVLVHKYDGSGNVVCTIEKKFEGVQEKLKAVGQGVQLAEDINQSQVILYASL
ncbi:hypothetical protein [Chromobacterium haemolyticum]|uniref:hypothetical protein n=1 Tax=Chromobacterium TaxID=535 RepID=UPI0012DE2985|nr:hypothetical protein [Chromobacterium haemolyticum]